MTIADGAKATLLLGLDQRLLDSAGDAAYQVGAGRFHLTEVAAPTAAPVVTPGAAGNVAGDAVSYKYSRVTIDRGETECSPASVPQTVTDQVVDVASLVWSADAAVDGLRVYRRIDDLAADQVTNGAFGSDLTGWTGTNWAQNAGKAQHTAGATAALTQALTLTLGAKYQVLFTISGRTAGNVTAAIGAAADSARSANGSYVAYLTAAAGGSVNLTFTPSSDFDGSLDDIKVQRITTEGDWLHVGTLWDSTHADTDLSDDLAPGSEDTATTPQTTNQTALNWGLREMPQDPGEVFSVEPVEITPQELTGFLGQPEPVQIRLNQPFAGSGSLRAGHLVAPLASLFGAPTVTRAATEPVRTYDFEPLEEPEDSVSLSGLFHLGGKTTRPLLFQAARVSEVEIGSPGNAELSVKWKGMAIASSQESPGYPDNGNSGTQTLAPFLRGARGDAGRYTDSVFMKVSTGPSAGTMGVQFKVGAGGTYGSEITVRYKTTTGRMYRYGSQAEPAVSVLVGAADDHLGLDTDRDFEPVACVLPGDLRLYAVNDVFEFLPENLIADARAGAAYSNQARLDVPQAIYTAARVTVLRGIGTATDFFDFEAATVKLSRSLKVKTTQGPYAKRGSDLILSGFVNVELGLTRFMDSREFERFARESQRLAWDIQIAGPKISTNPGTKSNSRELIRIQIPRGAHKIKRTVPAAEIREALTIQALQPADGSPHVTAQLVTGMGWDFSAIA